MKIVAYSDCVEHDKWEESWIGPIKEARNTRLTEPSDPQSFSNLLKFCPLCRGQMFEVFRGYKSGQGGEFELHSHITVYECETCEWWQCRDDFSEERDDPNK